MKKTEKMGILAYEKPKLKKYGTMKVLTLGAGGSDLDAIGIGIGGHTPDPTNDTADPATGDDNFNDPILQDFNEDS